MKPAEKRSETLYVYVKPSNKEFVKDQAKDFHSSSEYVDTLLEAQKNASNKKVIRRRRKQV